jgi:hypothetical protein
LPQSPLYVPYGNFLAIGDDITRKRIKQILHKAPPEKEEGNHIVGLRLQPHLLIRHCLLEIGRNISIAISTKNTNSIAVIDFIPLTICVVETLNNSLLVLLAYASN